MNNPPETPPTFFVPEWFGRRIVFLKWIDSSEEHGWVPLGPVFEHNHYPVIESVGILAREPSADFPFWVIFRDLGLSNGHACGRMDIPVACVISVVVQTLDQWPEHAVRIPQRVKRGTPTKPRSKRKLTQRQLEERAERAEARERDKHSGTGRYAPRPRRRAARGPDVVGSPGDHGMWEPRGSPRLRESDRPDDRAP